MAFPLPSPEILMERAQAFLQEAKNFNESDKARLLADVEARIADVKARIVQGPDPKEMEKVCGWKLTGQADGVIWLDKVREWGEMPLAEMTVRDRVLRYLRPMPAGWYQKLRLRGSDAGNADSGHRLGLERPAYAEWLFPADAKAASKQTERPIKYYFTSHPWGRNAGALGLQQNAQGERERRKWTVWQVEEDIWVCLYWQPPVAP